jgi:hypothetical protein
LSSAGAASRADLDVEHRNAEALQEETQSSYWHLRSVRRLPKPANWNKARLNMTTPPKMRDLAHRLLAYEAIATMTPEPMEAATFRVYEKLRQGLGEFAGVAGFQSLASRALALARTEAPSLSAVRVSEDGALLGLGQGLGEIQHQIDIDKDRAGESPAGEGEVILIARLLGLLLLFLGEALTLSLLRITWPGAAFDNRNSENGRKE